MEIDIATPAGREGLDAVLANPSGALLAFDYDGTLAPIVDDPARAIPHPDIVPALSALAGRVGTVAIITGRPAQVAVHLGGFADAPRLERLVVLGHYGLESWDATTGEVQTVPPAMGLAEARAALPELLESLGLEAADVEDKGLSVAVHVRRLADAELAVDRLDGPLRALANRCGLVAEPGRRVIELRPPGMDKGQALRGLVARTAPGVVAFTGDDLGDLAAFDEVERLRGIGVAGLLVCSGSVEEPALAERADLVVDGPAGVAELLRVLIGQIA